MSERRPVNILLVDDQPAKLLSYETILAELGENLIRANSGKEALEHLLKTDIAVVLVDVVMPDLDGFELSRMIREHPRFQKTAIILVSGVMVEDDDRLKGYLSGAMDYVSVPIVPQILRAKVSVFAELYRKTCELHDLNRDLERRVAERTGEITDAAARLRESEERMRLVLSAGATRAWTWDLQRNRVTSAMASGRDVEGRPFDDFLATVHPDDRVRVQEAFARALAGDAEYDVEFRVSSWDVAWSEDEEGEPERWLLGRGAVLRDADGRPESIAGIDIDITERKRIEDERAALLSKAQEARAEAERANRLKDEFLAVVSHELRTPLNVIVGWTHMLRAGALDEVGRVRALDAIQRSVMLQSQLVSDILDVSRIIAGKLRLEIQPLDLAGVTRSALDALRPAAQAKGIEISERLLGDAQGVLGDAQRLQQIAWNLLGNAIKFAPENGHVSVRLETAGPEIALVVEDDGPGIPPEFLPYIFDRFRQADSSSTRRHHGLGLGLAIVRHLTEMHGGQVHAANRPEGGAVFRVVLPRRQAAPPRSVTPPAGWQEARRDDAARREGAREAAPAIDAPPSLSGVRVVVVDDEPDNRDVAAEVLRLCGAEVRVAASAAEAFEMVVDDPPHALVADIEMPEEDGYALLRRIRALPHDKGGLTPAVALTAYATARDRMRILNAGFQMHVAKPVQPAELATVVASLVSTPAGRRGPVREPEDGTA